MRKSLIYRPSISIQKMQPGDRVKIVTSDSSFEGTYMKRPEIFRKGFMVLKLDNGYNIGIDEKNIKDTKVLEALKEKKQEKKALKHKKGLKKISILHTGGTIASKVDYRTGGVYSAFTPAELVAMFPELNDIANIESELIMNMWSDDLRFSHFRRIAETIKKKVEEGTDGIIIPMGTDNLAVASAALSFIVEKTPVPIILVGAQRSSDRGSSDAAMNLICAAEFMIKTGFFGVAVCMHENTSDDTCAILPAAKTRKLHSSRRDAFYAVNDSPIARINYSDKRIELLKEAGKPSELSIKPDMEERVGLLKVSVNMFPEQFSFYKGWKGLVIEGTGLGQTPGHAPNELSKVHEKIFPAIKEVIDSGCVVVMTTTCLFGRVGMNVYSKGRDLQMLGVIPGEDMLPETAFVKLAWLLANHPEQAKELVRKDLRGEINQRIQADQHL